MLALGTEEFFRILYGDEAPGFLPIFTHTPNRTSGLMPTPSRRPRGSPCRADGSVTRTLG